MFHKSTVRRGVVVAAAVIAVSSGSVAFATTPPSAPPASDMAMTSEPMAADAGPTGPLCAAVPTEGAGSVDGMAADPVATAASNNPLLTTLVAAVDAAGLVDTLNGEGPFTVFAPINSAFDKIPADTMQSVMGDTDVLSSILTYHVLPGQVSPADLVAGGTFTTVNGADLTVAMAGDTIIINGGAAAVQCAGVTTANATVYLIDSVLMPPAADAGTTAGSDAAAAPEASAPMATDDMGSVPMATDDMGSMPMSTDTMSTDAMGSMPMSTEAMGSMPVATDG